MTRHGYRWFAALVLALSASSFPAASAGPTIVEGEIVQVRESTDPGGTAPFSEVRIRTERQEEVWLRLGAVGESGHAYAIGDRVRARVSADVDPSGLRQALAVRNLTTGTRERFEDASGTVRIERARRQARDGSCAGGPSAARRRLRLCDPGSGGCLGGGAGRRGGSR